MIFRAELRDGVAWFLLVIIALALGAVLVTLCGAGPAAVNLEPLPFAASTGMAPTLEWSAMGSSPEMPVIEFREQEIDGRIYDPSANQNFNGLEIVMAETAPMIMPLLELPSVYSIETPLPATIETAAGLTPARASMSPPLWMRMSVAGVCLATCAGLIISAGRPGKETSAA